MWLGEFWNPRNPVFFPQKNKQQAAIPPTACFCNSQILKLSQILFPQPTLVKIFFLFARVGSVTLSETNSKGRLLKIGPQNASQKDIIFMGSDHVSLGGVGVGGVQKTNGPTSRIFTKMLSCYFQRGYTPED